MHTVMAKYDTVREVIIEQIKHHFIINDWQLELF